MAYPPPQPPYPQGEPAFPAQQTPPPSAPSPMYSPGPPAAGPQMGGPGGAYGPMSGYGGQPVPGQMPPASMSMSKPGTITGIQVILWIFAAISAIGDFFSVVSMIDFFTPWGLIGLGFATYSLVQSFLSPIHISRGKRWAWIWSLISCILGLLISAAAIVFGIYYIDEAPITLLIGIVLGGLYGTLLGLLVSKSARAWILMHRIQRGQVQVPGGVGAMPGAPGMAAPGMAPPRVAPQVERPATRTGSATFGLIVLGALVAVCAWALYDFFAELAEISELSGIPIFDLILDRRDPVVNAIIPLATIILLIICAVITGIGLFRGKAGGRIFGIVWTIPLALAAGFLAVYALTEYLDFRDFMLPPEVGAWQRWVARRFAMLALVITTFIVMLLPGVRRWTPGKPKSPMIMMVQMAQPAGQPGMQAPQGYAPQGYGQPQAPPGQAQPGQAPQGYAPPPQY